MFRKNLSIAECAKLIETWEVDRMASGAENVFDLKDKNDFRLMRRSRGLIATLKMRRVNRFWFDGFNYASPAPFPTTEEEARRLAENLIEERYVKQRPDLYAEFI